METRAHYILVGLFTLGTGIGALLFALWVTGAGSEREVNYYEVMFHEPVSGLSVGSPVQYSGIRVGEVEQLRLDPVDPRVVRARVRVLASAPIKVDTVARQTLLNITGAAAIELGEGLPESPLLRSDNGIPVIEASPSSLAQLRLTSEEILLSASNLLERANTLLSEENAARVSRVLDNVVVLTDALAGQEQSLQDGIQSLAASGESLNALLSRINDQMSRYEDTVYEGVTGTLDELQQATAQLNSLLTENSPAVTAGMQSLNELGPAVRDLRSILTTIDSITRRLADDPANFVLGNDQIREYQP
ncbi:MlaD family protein [Pseudohongiella spirulinae]|uniref:Mammalian cell entry domain-containing protein n=1 Tax=Pseudohongiella spirulinae TaxID=1249552 RepID=A0A0S2KGT6_9GAMM|nr:MlaD family protein [Pseudohongiella spirulinae]ALO47531.1 Mammalian cell entry domain-containing protein [Pseudohongiella spirulinae]